MTASASSKNPVHPIMENSLPEMVAAAVAGERDAWHSIVDRFDPLVLSIIRRYRLSQADGEDVRQTVWLRLVENLKKLRDPRALPGWIGTTTKNEAVRILAERHRLQPVDPEVQAELTATDQTDLDEGVILLERRRAVRESLIELSAERRKLMLLLFADSRVSYQRVGRQLGIPVGSIGPTRARCLNQLKGAPAIRALAS
jgi:RNA polymerase sigma factor (sigma-70 family)